jgi:hypothetical protein
VRPCAYATFLAHFLCRCSEAKLTFMLSIARLSFKFLKWCIR